MVFGLEILVFIHSVRRSKAFAKQNGNVIVIIQGNPVFFYRLYGLYGSVGGACERIADVSCGGGGSTVDIVSNLIRS